MDRVSAIFDWIIDPNSVTAVSTVVIAAFTIVLAWVGWCQSSLIRKSIDLARAEFLSTHRPRLIVRQFQLDPVLVDHPIRVTFSVINAGNTEATLRFVAGEVALWDTDDRIYVAPGIDPLQRPIIDERIRQLENGRRVAFTAESRFTVAEWQSDAVDSKRLRIRCIGEITYADRRGTDRRTGFHRTYEVETDMFIPSTNPDQEYQD
jgi:hypothetical protein